MNPIFFERLLHIYDKDTFEIVKKGLYSNKKSVFRVNTLKSNKQEIENFLNNNGIKFIEINFSKNVFIIDKKDEFFMKGTKYFYNGNIYFQSFSSQMPVMFFSNFNENDVVLDAFAAPGGKTTQLSDFMNNKGKIYACEKFSIRFDKLKYNIRLQGCKNVEALKIDVLNINKRFQVSTFNKILLDVPCSSEGKINLNIEKSYKYWNKDLIDIKNKEQKEFCAKLIPLLKEGGEFIYSTCSMAPEENEEIIDYILSNFNEMEIQDLNISNDQKLNLLFHKGICNFYEKKYSKECEKALRILPTDITEGFFIAKFIKKSKKDGL